MSGEGVTLHSLFTNMTGTHMFKWNTHKTNCKTCSCTLLTRARVLSQVLSGGASLGVLHVLRLFYTIVSSCVNINTTDATAGATTLLLPAQNTHTLQDPKRDTV